MRTRCPHLWYEVKTHSRDNKVPQIPECLKFHLLARIRRCSAQMREQDSIRDIVPTRVNVRFVVEDVKANCGELDRSV